MAGHLESPLEERRDRVEEALKNHFALGHLETEELERRLELTHRATSTTELDDLIADLPALPGEQMPQARATASRASGSIVAILGGSSRSGKWYPPRHLRVVTFLGGTELDFREAVLPAGGTDVDIHCVLGGVEITVPPGLTVQVEGIGILGAFEDRSKGAPPGETPVLRVTGQVILGGVEVKTRRPRMKGPFRRLLGS